MSPVVYRFIVSVTVFSGLLLYSPADPLHAASIALLSALTFVRA